MEFLPPDSSPRPKPATAWLVCVALTALATVGDVASGPFFLFDLFYLLPVLVAARWIGRASGLGFALVCAVLAVLVQYLTGHPLRQPLLLVWSGSMKFGVWAVAVWLVSELQRNVHRQDMLIHELRGAMSEIKQLKGLLPMCAWCKRLRSEDGSWMRLEDYLQERTDASVTHSICPECARHAIQGMKSKRGDG